jgi:hypothetical protein
MADSSCGVRTDKYARPVPSLERGARMPPALAPLQAHHDLARRLVGLHQAVRLLNVLEAKHLRGLRSVYSRGHPIDDILKWNLGEREFRRPGDERARKHAELRATRNLEHRLKCQGSSSAQEAHDAHLASPTQHGKRVEDRRVTDDVENLIDALGMPLPDPPAK